MGERLRRPPLRADRPAQGRLHPARRQVDLPPRRAVRRDVRRAGDHLELPRLAGHERDALRRDPALGAGVAEEADRPRVVIRGVGLNTPAEVTGGTLNVGNSGTLMRLLPGWLAGQPGGEWTLDGDDSIRRRPGRPHRRAAAPDGRGGRGARRTPAAVHHPGCRADGHRVRAARGQCPGEVVRADRRPARRRATRP